MFFSILVVMCAPLVMSVPLVTPSHPEILPEENLTTDSEIVLQEEKVGVLPCPVPGCTEKFETIQELEHHVDIDHPDTLSSDKDEDGVYTCPIPMCTKKFVTVQELEQHFNIDHPDALSSAKDCNIECPTNLDCHCGSNNETYYNACDLLRANCKDHDIKMAYVGYCDTRPLPSSCPKTWPCLDRYQPVCGTDNKTYDNDCYLVCTNCRDASIGLKHYGACDGDDDDHHDDDGTSFRVCEQTCSHIPTSYVCGSDNTIYRNLCELRNAGCSNTSLSQVDCPHTGPVAKSCSDVCNLDYYPKCGSNGRSYINQCHLDLDTCKDPSITLAHNGPCVSVKSARTKCTPCSGSEPLNYICGSNGKTYRSACAFNYALCMESCPSTLKVGNTGRCECKEDCATALHDPVCGSNGVTYESTCEFRVASCITPEITLHATGDCP